MTAGWPSAIFSSRSVARQMADSLRITVRRPAVARAPRKMGMSGLAPFMTMSPAFTSTL